MNSKEYNEWLEKQSPTTKIIIGLISLGLLGFFIWLIIDAAQKGWYLLHLLG